MGKRKRRAHRHRGILLRRPLGRHRSSGSRSHRAHIRCVRPEKPRPKKEKNGAMGNWRYGNHPHRHRAHLKRHVDGPAHRGPHHARMWHRRAHPKTPRRRVEVAPQTRFPSWSRVAVVKISQSLTLSIKFGTILPVKSNVLCLGLRAHLSIPFTRMV